MVEVLTALEAVSCLQRLVQGQTVVGKARSGKLGSSGRCFVNSGGHLRFRHEPEPQLKGLQDRWS